MGLLDFIRKKRLDRLEKDLRMIQNRINFNPSKATLNIEQYLGADSFTNRIIEYKVWNTGNSYLLRRFYTAGGGSDDIYRTLNYFWRNAPAEFIKKHSGIPQQISNKNGVIIFGGDFNVSVNVYKRDENGNITTDIDETASKKATDTLNALIEKTNIMQSLRKQAVIDSWCGHSLGKLNYDLTLSQYPIYEVYDLTQGEVISQRGIITSHIFKSYYKKGGTDYCFEEEYTTANGDACILNRLYKLKSDGSKVEVALTSIPETKDLERVFVFSGLKDSIGFSKPNKLPNNEYASSPYGASDYQGAVDSFDALDEAYSELWSELRNNKTIRYIPDIMIPKDKDGKPLIRNMGFITNYQEVEGSLDQETKNKIGIQQIDDKTESILNKYKNALVTAINNAGLSPLALGITGLEAINAGENSQKERNRVTLESRKDKIENYWKPYLKNFFTQLLAFNNWMVKVAGATQTLDNFDLEFDNCDIQLDFGNYIVEDETNIINRWGAAKTAGIASLDTCVRELHPDWTEEQILTEINIIKYEQGMDLDNPNNLPELTGVDDSDTEEPTEPNE